MLRRFIKLINSPAGIEVEWMTGGFRFMPPVWTWFVLFSAAILLPVILYG